MVDPMIGPKSSPSVENLAPGPLNRGQEILVLQIRAAGRLESGERVVCDGWTKNLENNRNLWHIYIYTYIYT